jgi:hypothetical protein
MNHYYLLAYIYWVSVKIYPSVSAFYLSSLAITLFEASFM